MPAPADLYAPTGELTAPVLALCFPGLTGGTLDTAVTTYITASTAALEAAGVSAADPNLDTAKAYWVYAAIFHLAADVVMTRPKSVTLANQGATVFSDAQAQRFADRAAEYAARWQAFVPAVDDGNTTWPNAATAVAVRNHFVF